MTFRIGMKVVCVDSSPCYMGLATALVKNQIYIVEKIIAPYWGDDEVGLVIVGAPSWHCDKCWRASRFRPVVERKTSIEIFTKMLKPSRVDA